MLKKANCVIYTTISYVAIMRCIRAVGTTAPFPEARMAPPCVTGTARLLMTCVLVNAGYQPTEMEAIFHYRWAPGRGKQSGLLSLQKAWYKRLPCPLDTPNPNAKSIPRFPAYNPPAQGACALEHTLVTGSGPTKSTLQDLAGKGDYRGGRWGCVGWVGVVVLGRGPRGEGYGTCLFCTAFT